MDALQAIFTRRSVRHFTTEPVGAAQVELLLRAAMSAPSSGNAQPWAFAVIDERAVLDEIAAFHASGAVVQEAQVCILVCGEPGREKNPGRWMLDCANATQNMLLAAHASGLGAVWLGIWPDPRRIEGMTRVMRLPEGVIPVALAAVGYPAETPAQADRFDPQRVHHNRW